MACGNTEVSREGLASQPTEFNHPTFLWLTRKHDGRADLYFDPAGNMRENLDPPDNMRSPEPGRFKDSGYQGLAVAILGKNNTGRPHAHFGAHIEGTDPETAVLVIESIYHGRFVPGRIAHESGGPAKFDGDRES